MHLLPFLGPFAISILFSRNSIDDFKNKYEDKYGAPYILVNNAAITRDNLFIRMKDDEWSEVIKTNLDSAYRMTKAFTRTMMKSRAGRIIYISSVVASTGNLGQANYISSKSGVEGLSRAIALELGPRNITVNVVAPGFIVTDMTNKLDDKTKEMMKERVPLGRFGSPEEVASVVAFLASDRAAYITGSVLHVNGGMYLS